MRASLFALALLGATGCPAPPAIESAATVRVAELPADGPALAKMADDFEARGDGVSLENALVVRDRQRAITPTDIEPAWRAAKDAFLLADDAEDDHKPRRAHFAQKCIDESAAAIAIDGKRVEGHYYRGICLGLLATTKTVGALDLVKELLAAGKAAIAADASFDHGGPERLVGALLLKAPGWPTSVGDSDEALTHLQKAVELDKDFPPNHLWLAEALLANDKPVDAQRELALYDSLPPMAALTDRSSARWKKQADELRGKLAGKMH